jgi:hypothetical protein
MALQPKSGPGLPCWGFVTITFLQGWIVSPRPTPNLEDQVSVFMTPGDRVAQLYPQALGTHFSRLLRHAWVTVGLFFNPDHTREDIILHHRVFRQERHSETALREARYRGDTCTVITTYVITRQVCVIRSVRWPLSKPWEVSVHGLFFKSFPSSEYLFKGQIPLAYTH